MYSRKNYHLCVSIPGRYLTKCRKRWSNCAANYSNWNQYINNVQYTNMFTLQRLKNNIGNCMT